MLNFHPYSILIGDTMVGFVIFCVLKIKRYLLGSTVDREASQKEREKDQPTFKDNDFLKDGVKIHIGEEAKAKLMETLKG